MDWNGKYTLDNFVVAECNREAFGCACSIAKGDYSELLTVFIGSVGLGKQHLIYGIEDAWSTNHPKGKVLNESVEKWMSDYYEKLLTEPEQVKIFIEEYENADLLLLRNLHLVLCKERHCRELLKNLIMKRIEFGKPTVIGTIQMWDEIIVIGKKQVLVLTGPDFETAERILCQKMEQDHIPKEWFEEGCVSYIAHHANENVRVLEGSFNKVIFKMKVTQKNIVDLEFVKGVIKEKEK